LASHLEGSQLYCILLHFTAHMYQHFSFRHIFFAFIKKICPEEIKKIPSEKEMKELIWRRNFFKFLAHPVFQM
jgi:hypothetical protein